MTTTAITPPYRPLPARARRWLFIKETLWMGSDHVLWVSSYPFSETYRRLYFKDIATIAVRQTEQGSLRPVLLLAGLILSLTALVSSLLLPAGLLSYFSIAFWGALAVFFMVLVISHNSKAPSCEFWVRTAVQVVRLECIRTNREAEQIVAVLRRRIMEAQQDLPKPVIPSKDLIPEDVAGLPPIPPVETPEAPLPHAAMNPRSDTRPAFLKLPFLLMLMAAAIESMRLWSNQFLLVLFSQITLLAIAVSTIPVLVRLRQGFDSRRLSMPLWIGLGFVLLRNVMDYAYAWWWALETTPQGVSGIYSHVSLLAENPVWNSPALLGIVLSSIGILFVLGALGMVGCQRMSPVHRQSGQDEKTVERPSP